MFKLPKDVIDRFCHDPRRLVLVGPVVVTDPTTPARLPWYFTTAHGAGAEFSGTAFPFTSCEDAEDCRAALILSLSECKPPLAIIVLDDELAMAKAAAAAWPTERSRGFVTAIEAERKIGDPQGRA